MEFLIGSICAVLLTVFIVQIGKARELASIVRDDKNEQYEINRFHANFGLFFVAVFLIACVASFIYYIPYMLGWGPNTAASEHGPQIDYMFNLTLFFTGIVFFLTHIALFYFAWKYRGRKGHSATYWAHDERLEMVWMLIPAVVMTFLIVGGLQAWNVIMDDVEEGEEFLSIEATGRQFGWDIRFPGRDSIIGSYDFRETGSKAPVGQVYSDANNIDDFMPQNTDIVLPVGKTVRASIRSRDVLHNFYIRDFRVKMDAVPGMPTYFVFKPMVTTDSMRRRLSDRPEWQAPDKLDKTKKRWQTYNYELACAELCGKGHYSMSGIIKVVSQEEYEAWLDEKEGEVRTTMDSTGTKVYSDMAMGSVYMTNVFAKLYEDKTLSDADRLEQMYYGSEEFKQKVQAFIDLVEMKTTAKDALRALYEDEKDFFKVMQLMEEETLHAKLGEKFNEQLKAIKDALSILRTTRKSDEARKAMNLVQDKALAWANLLKQKEAKSVENTGNDVVPMDSTSVTIDSVATDTIE